MKHRWKFNFATILFLVVATPALAVDITSMFTPEQALEMARQANGGTLTPEQEARIWARYGRAAPVSIQPTALPVESEEALGAKLSALPQATKGVTVDGKKDGFNVNGQPFMDAEGTISFYAFDTQSGEVTYLVEVSPGQFTVKYNHLGNSQDGIAIATAQRSGTAWQVQTASGKKLRGEQLVVLARGVMLARGTVAFKYVPGAGLQNISLPEGWMMANYQRGNVGATNLLLLEKIPAPADGGGLFSTLKSLGNTVTLNEDRDYALMNLKDGKLTEFAVGSSGKTIADPRGCVQRTMFANDCSNARQIESLYDKTGGRNINHYFWRIDWFNTPQGPLVVALENLMKDLTLTDIKADKKVVAFNRTLGIKSMDASMTSEGKIKIAAQLGFSTETIEDAVSFLNKPQPQENKPQEQETATKQ